MKNLMKKHVFPAAVAIFAGAASAATSVTDVKVSQNWPWDGKVNIDYTLNAPADARVDVDIRLRDGTRPIDMGWGACEASNLYSKAAGTYRLTWDPARAVGATKPVWSQFTADVTANSGDTYLVIDLTDTNSVGQFASTAITYTDTPPAGGWNADEYKQTKIVMRKIPAGTFTMGSPKDEIGHSDRREALHPVTFTNFFYLGVFEVTERQYCIIEGLAGGGMAAVANNANRTVASGIACADLRGANRQTADVFPGYEADSFFGRLNPRFTLTGPIANYVFDLPSISQWEYACRAGTTSSYNNGLPCTAAKDGDKDPNLTPIAWYRQEGVAWCTRAVGGKLPNAFGLYDMHGNAAELCMDVISDTQTLWTEGEALVEPLAYKTAYAWGGVSRGGDEENEARNCRSAVNNVAHGGGRNIGFRLALVARRK